MCARLTYELKDNEILKACAPAKLNLFLHLTGQQADGYHTLQTVFQLLNYYDELYFVKRHDENIKLQCKAISLLVDSAMLSSLSQSDNLVYQAARSLQERYKVKQGVAINLHKRIPLGGGLGGGSSDAAATLLALKHLWQLDCPFDSLLEIGLKLSKDIPVFLQAKSAWGEGVGEQLHPIELANSWFLVVMPGISVSTSHIFKAANLTRNSSPITIADFLRDTKQTRNDCEFVVASQYPAVAEALAWLNAFVPARLTGTGSCIFARIDTKQAAQDVLKKLPLQWKGFVAQGVSQFVMLVNS